MSGVQAATMASAGTMGELRAAAMKAGADTAFSAGEAADAIKEMAKAGVSTADIMGGGLNGALSLAAAGQMGVADAAEIASVAMTQFNLAGTDLPHVADLLAAGAGKAMGEVSDLGAALNQAGLVASAAGMSIEETTGTLAAFAAAGLVGSDAGTSLKTMLQRLQNPSAEAAGTMEELGISMYDANGEFVGMEAVAGQLKTGMEGMTPAARDAAMAVIFGSDAVRAANVLYANGATGIADWTGKVNDAGYAAEQAAILQDNLKGDLEKLGGAWDTLMISLGEGSQGPLRMVVQGLTGLVDVIGPVMGAFGKLGGVLADNYQIVVPLAAAFGLHLAGGIAAANVALSRFVLTPIVLGLSGVLSGLTAVAGFMSGGFVAAAGAARTAVMGLIASVAPLAAVAAVVYGTFKLYDFATAAGDAEDEVRGMWKAVADSRGTEQLDGLNTMIGQLEEKVASLRLNLADDGAWETTILGAMITGAAADAEALEVYQRELDEAKEKQDQVRETSTLLGERLHLNADEVVALAGKYGVDLTDNTEKARWAFEAFYAAEFGTTPIDAANATGVAMDSAKAKTEQALAAQEQFIADLSESMAGFVEPLGAYTGLLETKIAADRKAAEETAAGTESSKDSWEDYVTDVKVSFEEYKAALIDQVSAQTNWQTNMMILAGRVSQGTLDELSRMGPEGAPLVADLVNRSDAELAEMDDLFAARSQDATDAWAAKLAAATPVLAEIGKKAGAGVVAELAAQLQAGTITVAQIAAQYGINLAGGLNPILTSLGKPRIVGSGPNRATFAEGGFTGMGGKYEPAGIVHKGEYVLTKEQTARLGINEIEAFANRGYATGGYVTAADVPRPSSTSPYRQPISTAGDATMEKAYNEVKAFVGANAGGIAGSGAVGGAWGSIWQYVKARIPAARINSTFRAGDPGYHGRGKAIDFGYGTGPGGNGSAGLASINRVLHDGIGRNLAELIYDGIGDDRADLKNGRPLTYNAGTRAAHKNHVHAAVYHQGTDYVPQTGWGYLEKGEAVIPAALNPKSREFSGGRGGTGGNVAVAAPVVHVTLDGRELRHVARVEAAGVVAASNAQTARNVRSSL